MSYKINHTFKVNPTDILSILTLIIIILVIINGLSPQIQIALLGGVFVPSIFFKLTLICILVAVSLIGSGASNPKWVVVSVLILFIYLLFVSLRLLLVTNLTVNYIIFGMNSYYFFFLVLPFVYKTKIRIDPYKTISILYYIAIPIIILGILQWWMRSPIVPTKSVDESFFVGSYQFNGVVRAFSLFSSPFDFGQFLLIIFSISLSGFMLVKRSLWTLIMVILSLIGLALTLTRNIYIGTFCIFSTILLIKYIKNWRLLIPLPIVYGLLAFILAANSNIFKNRKGLADVENLNIRLDQWSVYLNSLWRSGVDQLLFGNGFVQNDRFSQSEGVLIDNTYLAVITHIGIVGLILIIVFMIFAWIYALSLSHLNKNPLTIGLCALLSVSLAMGVFNVVLVLPSITIVLFVMLSRKNPRKILH